MKDIIENMGNNTMFIAIGNKGEDIKVQHSKLKNGFDIIEEIMDEPEFSDVRKIGMIDPITYENEIHEIEKNF